MRLSSYQKIIEDLCYEHRISDNEEPYSKVFKVLSYLKRGNSMDYNEKTNMITDADLYNYALDRTVTPPVLAMGFMGKTSGGSWVAVSCTSAGAIIVS